MMHYSFDQWLQYVRNEVSEDSRIELESHLYTCDACLEQYLKAVEENESLLPTISEAINFTEMIMTQVQSNKESEKRPFYQKMVFHYLLAAVATILLTLSGAFHSLATYAGTVESNTEKNHLSVTEGVMNKTMAWMDSIEKKEANKK